MNWDMIGQEWAVDLLREHVVRDRTRHAYLLVGPQGIGRRTLALRFAQALNCLRPPVKGEYCGECRICTQIARMQHADLTVIQSEEGAGSIKVDQIRELQYSLALAPYEARYRVALLLRFEEATTSAMNALLKTLEEPAPQVILILSAESRESLLPTIVSRCEVLRLRPLPVAEVVQGLYARWDVPEEQARLAAHISAGRPGFALQLCQEPEQIEIRKSCLDDHWRLLSANRVERFAYAESLAKDKDALIKTIEIWLSFWRDVMLRTIGTSASVVNLDRQNEIAEIAAQMQTKQVYQNVAALERTLESLNRNVNPRLVIEVLMLDLPFR